MDVPIGQNKYPVDISQNFVAFSEYMNFTYLAKNRQKQANLIEVFS